MSLLTKEAAGAKVSTVFKRNLQTWEAENFLNFIHHHVSLSRILNKKH